MGNNALGKSVLPMKKTAADQRDRYYENAKVARSGRRSSGVEHLLGKEGAGGSIPPGGTIFRRSVAKIGVAGLTHQYLYFIQSGADGPIKIGIARRPLSRLEAIQTSNPTELRLLGWIIGGREAEKQWHVRHRYKRRIGEWFEAMPDLVNDINRSLNQRAIKRFDWARSPNGIRAAKQKMFNDD